MTRTLLKVSNAWTRLSAIAIVSVCLSLIAHAGEVEFSARVDRTQVAEDDSVALKFDVKTDGSASPERAPEFSAPDFDLINDYTSTYVESYYENGHFGMRNTQQYTKVLRPKRTGELTISGLKVQVAGKSYTAPDVVVNVTASGAGTPPPRGYGGAGVGLRGASKRGLSGTGFFVRAEVDKEKIFLGEQVIVSYYLYRRVRVFNIQVDKYPVLSGFLREDLEMPVLTQRLDTERVTLDGTVYDRSLLTRYAAYPLKTGKLPIDSMSIKAAYYGQTTSTESDDPFMNFFQQMAPREGTSTSDSVSVEVEPLPDGKPANFSGGIGSFNISSSVDRSQLKTGEAVTLTLKVEGKGNLSAIEQPKLQLPDVVDLYESKGRTQGGKGGIGERIFEYLLVPRKAGHLELPEIEMGFFDPTQGHYLNKKTASIAIEVSLGPGGEHDSPSLGRPQVAVPGVPANQAHQEQDGQPKIFGLRLDNDLHEHGVASWMASVERAAVLLGFIAVMLLAGLIGKKAIAEWQQKQRLKQESDEAKTDRAWEELTRIYRKGDKAKLEMVDLFRAYESLSGLIYRSIDRSVGIAGGSRSYPRSELGRLLQDEHGIPEPLWTKISGLLEFAELVRYASKTGVVSEQQAQAELRKWVKEGQAIREALVRRSNQPGQAGLR